MKQRNGGTNVLAAQPRTCGFIAFWSWRSLTTMTRTTNRQPPGVRRLVDEQQKDHLLDGGAHGRGRKFNGLNLDWITQTSVQLSGQGRALHDHCVALTLARLIENDRWNPFTWTRFRKPNATTCAKRTKYQRNQGGDGKPTKITKKKCPQKFITETKIQKTRLTTQRHILIRRPTIILSRYTPLLDNYY